jgi:hypothetical protein
MEPDPLVAGGECIVADLADGVVQALESFRDAFPGHVSRQADGALQAETDVIEAGRDPVEQLLAAVCLLCRDSGPGEIRKVFAPPGLGDIPDHSEGQVPGRGRHRAEADLDGERPSVLAQPDKPCPGALGRALGACA